MNTELTYRKGIIAIVVNNQDEFLVLNLIDYKDDEWNFPGGGSEGDESETETLYRELKEELGIEKENIEIIGKSKTPLQYDFPKDVVEQAVSQGKYYKGQIKQQLVVRYNGDSDSIKIQEEEVSKYKWIKKEELKDHLKFPNQYENAINVIEEILNK